MSTLDVSQLLMAGDDAYQISRSVRLRSSASAYLNRTPAGAGTSSQKFTWSGWVKRGTLTSGYQVLFMGGNTTNDLTFCINFDTADKITARSYGGAWVTSNGVYRDPSAWYHIVVAVDTTQATSTDRVKLYVNGTQASSTYGTAIPLNYSFSMSTAVPHTIGYQSASWGFNYFDGYLTEVNFVDGQALSASSFGTTDQLTGAWVPMAYTGTYGANGFYLNFSDNSAATAAAIGKDSSGNGNNWTPNNISVTAGATYDSMIDVPTPYVDGGTGRGNYCVLNPLNKNATAISQGNLYYSGNASGAGVFGSIAVSSGKWYFECTVDSGSGMVGVADATLLPPAYNSGNAWGYYSANGNKFPGNAAYGASWTAGDVIGVALDADNGTLTFYKNNTSQGTAFTGLTGKLLAPYFFDGFTSPLFFANFGQRPFSYTPPTGFLALNTQNLPDSTIVNGKKYFDATTYTGNASTLAVTNSGFQPDLVWLKNRASAYSHGLYDSVRGVGSTKGLYSNETSAEGTNSTNQNLVSFDSSGFTVGTTSSTNVINTSGQSHVAWQWKKGATPGFDIVTYTGNSTAGRTVAHSLGVVPSMIITKSKNTALGHWAVYHKSVGNTKVLYLDQTIAATAGASWWNNTSPTSSVFTVGSGNDVNGASDYVAYLFSEVAGFSKFGSYTGDGSADGPFVYLGFKARYVLYKNTTLAGTSWAVLDTARNTYNVMNGRLFAEASSAEDTSVTPFDITANGIKVRSTNDGVNRSGDTIIFAAFAENPFKNSLAR